VTEQQLADAAQLASLADETPEGRSIVVLAKQVQYPRARDGQPARHFVPFTAQTRMSGVDIRQRRCASCARARPIHAPYVEALGQAYPADVRVPSATSPAAAARRWWWSTMAASGRRELKDIVKGGIKERFAELRRMGIKTVMITGDNR
jgi:K+-transporting ATPase ATPase B chain